MKYLPCREAVTRPTPSALLHCLSARGQCMCVCVCGGVSVCECLFCSCVAPVVVGAAVAVCFRLRFMAAHRGCQWWPTAWLAQGKESGGEGSRVSARRTYVLAWLHINSGIFCCCYDASGVKVFSGSICKSVAWGKKNTVAVQQERVQARGKGVNTTHFVYNFSLSDFLAFGFCLPFSFWHSHFVALALLLFVFFARLPTYAICLFMSLFICLFLYLQS